MLHKVGGVWKEYNVFIVNQKMSGICNMNGLVVSLGNLNGRHVDKHIDGFDNVQGGFSVGKGHLDGIMLLLCLRGKLCVTNTWFKVKLN